MQPFLTSMIAFLVLCHLARVLARASFTNPLCELPPRTLSPFELIAHFLQPTKYSRELHLQNCHLRIMHLECHLENSFTLCRVSFCAKEGIGGFLPALPSPPIFAKDAKFKHFLLAKIVNAERAAMRYELFKIPPFSLPLVRLFG